LSPPSVLPFDTFRDVFTSTRESIFDAEQILMAQCMSRAGFRYEATKYGQTDMYFGIYGMTDRARAATLGYTRPELDTEPDLMRVESRKMPANPAEKAAFLLALNGDESKPDPVPIDNSGLPGVVNEINFPAGCLATADLSLFGSRERYARYQAYSNWAQLTLQGAVQSAMSSAGGQSAAHDWSACMAAAGYRFTDVYAPYEVEWPEPRPGAKELLVASADVKCKSDVQYLERIRGVQLQIERSALDANPGALDGLETLRNEVIHRAADIVHG
jgi:hypothetical protein